jgi:hypothetical protein
MTEYAATSKLGGVLAITVEKRGLSRIRIAQRSFFHMLPV